MDLEIVTPKGNGTTTRHVNINQTIKGIKKEIIDAYLRDWTKEYTTRDIISRINYTRYTKNLKQLERSNLSRPHSELVGDGIIIDTKKIGYDYYYKINSLKARNLLNRGKF